MNEDQLSEVNKDFLKEVFKEMNSHARATDRKSLLVTSAYISLFSLFLSSIAIGRWSDSIAKSPSTEILVQTFFLVVGFCIFVMQQWYRAWKEHYFDVCLEIRKQFMPKIENLGLLPYWLREGVVKSRTSIDNLLKYLTGAVNFVLVLLICYDLYNILPNKFFATLIVLAIIFGYWLLIYLINRGIHKNKYLYA